MSHIPQIKLHHRLAVAMEDADVSPEDMAADLGIHVNTVYNYAAGRTEPKLGTIKQWALRCDVPWQWVKFGYAPEDATSSQDDRQLLCTVSPLFLELPWAS